MPRYAGIGVNNQDGKVRRAGGRIAANYRTGRGLTGQSRSQERQGKLGIIAGNMMAGAQKVRCEELDKFDKYLVNEQYDSLMPWDAGDADAYIPLRSRKPRVIFNLPKRIVNTVAAKLCGEDVFPRFAVEDDPDSDQFLAIIGKAGNLQLNVLYAVKKALGCGSSFLRYYVVGAVLRMEVYDSKYCYPEFDDEGQLDEVEIRYVYTDEEDKDERGNPKQKWFRMVLSREADVLFDNPDFVAGATMPEFVEVSRADHGFGFVQGEWFRTEPDKHCPDGPALIADCLDLFDAINYSLSQADQAVAYAQEPQLAVSGMDIDEVDELVKSSQKAWDLGRDGKAEFLAQDMTGVEKGMELRDKKRQAISDVCRVVMLDPEKIVGSAQSAKAMEVLHGPLVELVGELRQSIGPSVTSLMTKLAVTLLELNVRGENEIVVMPAGYEPKSLNITLTWPEIFPMTMEDLQKKMAVANTAATAQIISRESLTRWVAKDFGIENIEEELARIAAQPPLPSAFGAF